MAKQESAVSVEELGKNADDLLGLELAEQLRGKFRRMALSDGFMFGEVMRDASLCVPFLEKLLGVQIDHVEYLTKEKDISDSFTGHGIRVDIYLKDGKGTIYSIEMDTSGSGSAYRLRIRFYQGTIDRNNLEKGKDYTKLPRTFLIIISTEDFFRKGLAVYKRKMLMEGYQDPDGEVRIEDFAYEDGTALYILNANYTIGNADKEILQFLDCIHLNDTNPDRYDSPWMKGVCRKIEEVRDDPAEEVYYMGLSVIMMDERRKGREEGRKEGLEEGLEKGLEKGAIINTVDIYRNEMGFDDRTIIDKLIAKFNLTYHDAAGYVLPRSA